MFPRCPLRRHMPPACLKHTAPVQISDMSALAQTLGKIQGTSTASQKLNLSQREMSYLIWNWEQKTSRQPTLRRSTGEKKAKNTRGKKSFCFSVVGRFFSGCPAPSFQLLNFLYPLNGFHPNKAVFPNLSQLFSFTAGKSWRNTFYLSRKRQHSGPHS